MKIKGRVHKFGDNVNTDEIIPTRFLVTSDPKQLGKHCMAGIDPGFARRVKKGDIIVAGENFGCGSSREHAPVSIKACGISCIVAESFARIFYRNAINIGLPILEYKQASKIANRASLEIDLSRGEIRDVGKKKLYFAQGFPEFMQEIIQAGGLMQWVRKRYTKLQ